MALISEEYRFIYLLNPRTASTATSTYLRENAGARYIPKNDIEDENGVIVVPKKHTKLDQLIKTKLIDEDTANAYCKFVTVRNPFDSLVSLWSKMTNDYRSLLQDTGSWVHKQPDYKVRMQKSVGLTFPEWVFVQFGGKYESGKAGSVNRSFVRGADRILRFERLQDDFARIASDLRLPGDHVIPLQNVTKGREDKSYRSYYDEDSRKVVEAVFAPEIKELDYAF